jgi:hypothetical protein
MEVEPSCLKHRIKESGMDLELRDDPIIQVDQFRLMAQPAGRDVTQHYAVA